MTAGTIVGRIRARNNCWLGPYPILPDDVGMSDVTFEGYFGGPGDGGHIWIVQAPGGAPTSAYLYRYTWPTLEPAGPIAGNPIVDASLGDGTQIASVGITSDYRGNVFTCVEQTSGTSTSIYRTTSALSTVLINITGSPPARFAFSIRGAPFFHFDRANDRIVSKGSTNYDIQRLKLNSLGTEITLSDTYTLGTSKVIASLAPSFDDFIWYTDSADNYKLHRLQMGSSTDSSVTFGDGLGEKVYGALIPKGSEFSNDLWCSRWGSTNIDVPAGTSVHQDLTHSPNPCMDNLDFRFGWMTITEGTFGRYGIVTKAYAGGVIPNPHPYHFYLPA